ncbi:MAG TPA: hypothetical protein DD381_04965 [Lentisphaeria bacterium]|nr:MAG: hypothetical protein A2X47_01875 [Lentisphaerae bacterium GWF2_38_69]HBM15681.1 hypothetical protein [Lentisphaeria bacterium]
MIKFVKISKKDIIFDRKNASAVLNKACERAISMELSGGFETDERIVLCLEEVSSSKSKKIYTIVPVEDWTEDGLIGEINIRYTAGFSFSFSFKIDDSVWAIFYS